MLQFSGGPLTSPSSQYPAPPPPLYRRLLLPPSPSLSPPPPHPHPDPPTTSYSERDTDLLREIGIDPPVPPSQAAVDWFHEFTLSRQWLHGSLPHRSAEDAYSDAWMLYQGFPQALESPYYSYPHFELFHHLAAISSVDNVWREPSRCVTSALLGADKEILIGLESEYHSFMFYYEKQILLTRAAAGYNELIDDVLSHSL